MERVREEWEYLLDKMILFLFGLIVLISFLFFNWERETSDSLGNNELIQNRISHRSNQTTSNSVFDTAITGTLDTSKGDIKK